MPKTTQDTAVYRFFDQADNLLYVGITNNIKTRCAAHARDHALTWWPKVARRTVDWYATRAEAAAAEVTAIKTESPLHNQSHAPSPTLVSTSGGVPLSAEDWHAYDGEWVNFAEIARRLVSHGIEKQISRARVMQIAKADPQFPLPRSQWRFTGNMWLLPWPMIESYFRARERPVRRPKKPKQAEPSVPVLPCSDPPVDDPHSVMNSDGTMYANPAWEDMLRRSGALPARRTTT